jgi:hypothetical protein
MTWFEHPGLPARDAWRTPGEVLERRPLADGEL